MDNKTLAVKIVTQIDLSTQKNDLFKIAVGEVEMILTEYESDKVQELQKRLDEICKYADKVEVEDVSHIACHMIRDIANGEKS